MASSTINLIKGQWISIDPLNSEIIQITHTLGNGTIQYTESSAQPVFPYSISNYSNIRESLFFFNLKKGEFIWLLSNDNDASVTLTM